MVFGTLRAELTESIENPSLLKKPQPQDNSPTIRQSYSPGPTHMRVSILEPSTSQENDPIVPREDFEKAVADSDFYLDLKAQIDEKDAKIMELEVEKQDLTEQIERIKDSYQQEIEQLKKEQKVHLNDIQNMRITYIEQQQSEERGAEPEKREIERLKSENLKFAKEIKEKQQIFDNEVLFLKEEIEGIQKKNRHYKENFNKVVNERDVYGQKLNHLVNYIRKKKAEKEQEQSGGLFGLRLSLFRR